MNAKEEFDQLIKSFSEGQETRLFGGVLVFEMCLSVSELWGANKYADMPII